MMTVLTNNERDAFKLQMTQTCFQLGHVLDTLARPTLPVDHQVSVFTQTQPASNAENYTLGWVSMANNHEDVTHRKALTAAAINPAAFLS